MKCLQRYDLLFEQREKQYHLLNCSTYPPQVAALLRSLIYQERELGNQPEPDGTYAFDLPIDVIACASQPNRTEQVIKGMRRWIAGKIKVKCHDIVRVIDPKV